MDIQRGDIIRARIYDSDDPEQPRIGLVFETVESILRDKQLRIAVACPHADVDEARRQEFWLDQPEDLQQVGRERPIGFDLARNHWIESPAVLDRVGHIELSAPRHHEALVGAVLAAF